MADSHGRPESIKAAFTFLKQEMCEEIYHLGDICDSSRTETAEACIHQIQENGIKAIRGNNDQRIINLLGRIKSLQSILGNKKGVAISNP